MKQSFFSMFDVVYSINNFLLTSIGIYLLVCRNTWLMWISDDGSTD